MSEAERFAEALGRLGGTTVLAGSRSEALAEIAKVAGEQPVVIDRHADLDGVAEGLTVVDDPWAAEVGVTSAVVAAAETGTLGLVFDAERPRSTSLVPLVHVALVPDDRLVPSYADAVSRLAEQQPVPSGMQFITGPSSSGDIEMTIVRGVHGPRDVHVIFYPA